MLLRGYQLMAARERIVLTRGMTAALVDKSCTSSGNCGYATDCAQNRVACKRLRQAVDQNVRMRCQHRSTHAGGVPHHDVPTRHDLCSPENELVPPSALIGSTSWPSIAKRSMYNVGSRCAVGGAGAGASGCVD